MGSEFIFAWGVRRSGAGYRPLGGSIEHAVPQYPSLIECDALWPQSTCVDIRGALTRPPQVAISVFDVVLRQEVFGSIVTMEGIGSKTE